MVSVQKSSLALKWLEFRAIVYTCSTAKLPQAKVVFDSTVIK